MEEVWKDVNGYEGLYQVSNLGNVRSLDHYVNGRNGQKLRKGKPLKFAVKNGYLRVCLSKNNVRDNFFVHRLVAIAFIQNPNGLPIINHKDENKSNNFVWVNQDGSIDAEKSNLEWCTSEYNVNYGTATERRSYTRLIDKSQRRKDDKEYMKAIKKKWYLENIEKYKTIYYENRKRR